VEGIGPDAELLVRFPDGTREAVSSGEVSIRGMYGYL
jgi:biotin-(acetyl-CoA carboxylase) ligase